MSIDYLKTAQFCKENWPERAKKVISVADDVCENRFLFDMPWDMERTEEALTFDDKIDWFATLNGDNESLFQFNRHCYFLHLLQAYYLTGDEKYAKKYCELLIDWIDRVPLDDGNETPWRSLEVGMRCETWVKAIDYIKGTKFYTDELKEKFEKSLKQHIDVLIEKHAFFQKGSNWGVIQDSGLFCAAAYFNDKKNMNLAIERLSQQTDLQIMNDGMHWEQSSGYHNAVLFCLLNDLLVAKRSGYEISKSLNDKIYSMAYVNLKWVKPNGQQPLLGDSDANDIRDVLCRCAIIFDSAEFKSLAYDVLDYDSAWIFGTEGIKKFKSLDKKLPEFECTALRDSGSYILRSDWSKTANWLCMHNGYTGGGHAHADKLHFDLMIGGKDVLVDSGRCTYMYNDKRKFIKEPEGHNTCIIGDKDFLVMDTQWSVINPALSVQYPMYDNEKCTLIGGGHLGYLESAETFVEREILYIKPNIYIVLDNFKCHCKNTYHQFFHFAPCSEVTFKDNVAAFTDGDVKANLHLVSEGVEASKMNSIYSCNYNSECSNPAFSTTFDGDSNRTAITVIYGDVNEKFVPFEVQHEKIKIGISNEILDYNVAEGIVIKTQDKEYTICLAHKELKTPYVCNEKVGTGRIMVFENDDVIFRKW